MWNTVKNETLFCRKDSRRKVAEYDKHAIAVFKSDDQQGHMSTELSDLIDYYPGNTKKKRVSAVVVDQRKRDVSLVVTAKYSEFTKELQ